MPNQDIVENFVNIAYSVCSVLILYDLIRFTWSSSAPRRISQNEVLPEAETLLLEHGFGNDELQRAYSRVSEDIFHPFKISLRILFPSQMALSLIVAFSHLVILITAVWSLPPSSRFYASVLVNSAIISGWISSFLYLRMIRLKIKTIDTPEAALSTRGLVNPRFWAGISLCFYSAQCLLVLCAGYHLGFFVLYVVNLILCIAFACLEVLKWRDLSSEQIPLSPMPSGNLRKREKNWILLLGIAFKYVWPDTIVLRMRVIVCLILVVMLRVLNIIVPYTYKKVIDEFTSVGSDTVPFPTLFYPWVAYYMLSTFLQGGTGGGTVGILPNLRSYLWIPISQSAYKRISLDIFAHVLALDHHFHLYRKTGELMRIMDRGTASVQTLLGTVMFSIGPAIFDIAAASMFLGLKMQFWIAIIVFVSLGIYIPMTIYVTEWRSQYRRQLNQLDNARSARATDALLNYETVKIFGNERLEKNNYRHAIDEYQKIDFKLIASMNVLNVLQSFVIFAGLISGLIICTYGVANGTLTVGDTVLFVTMMQQLYAPLNFFGTYYRMLQNAALDMEGVFSLLETDPLIKDSEEARPITGDVFSISFKDVRFTYNGMDEILKGISFLASSGKTTSFVGATGGGKSTILRLLVRFYDPTSGEITIGGHSLSQIKLESLRKTISVVPQDTVLLNDTIWYNIKYGNPSASDEEIIEATKGACLYDTIMTKFPSGFDTLVGERGLRLSGGEKQRVAFARAILKNPPVLVLDEATSALDSITEHHIQKTLASRRKERTVIIVAHRLSTIVDSDKIIVVDNGEIVEQGTHDELLKMNNAYALLWNKQSSSGAI